MERLKLFQIDARLAEALLSWRAASFFPLDTDWVLPMSIIADGIHTGDNQSCARSCAQLQSG
jgi:hypothetical protein